MVSFGLLDENGPKKEGPLRILSGPLKFRQILQHICTQYTGKQIRGKSILISVTSSRTWGVWIEGFWYFSLEIIAFGERAKVWIPGGIWRGQNVRRTDFKKHWKTLGICKISSFWRVRFEGCCYFSIGFNAFCERRKVSISEGIWSDQKGDVGVNTLKSKSNHTR